MKLNHFCSIEIVTFALLISSIESACSKTNIRKEWRELSNPEQTEYFDAVNKLKSSGLYDPFVKQHEAAFGGIHGTSVNLLTQFLPWHRRFILDFEIALQKINPNVILPFWQWSIDSQDVEKSSVYSDFGGGGSSSGRHCLKTGPFANWKATDGSCLARRYGDTDPVASPEQIQAVLGMKTYTSFQSLLEIKHTIFHITVGWNEDNINGQIYTSASVDDNLFMLHHAYIDKIWASWQAAAGQSGRYTEYALDKNEALLEIPGQIVANNLDHRALCYKYSNGVQRNGKPPPKPPTTVTPGVSTEPDATVNTDAPATTVSAAATDAPVQTTHAPSTTPSVDSEATNLAEGPSTTPSAPTGTVPSTSPAPSPSIDATYVCPYTDKTNKHFVRNTKPLTKAYCEMMGLNYEYVLEEQKVADQINYKTNYRIVHKKYIAKSSLAAVENATYTAKPADFEVDPVEYEEVVDLSLTAVNVDNPKSPLYTEYQKLKVIFSGGGSVRVGWFLLAVVFCLC